MSTISEVGLCQAGGAVCGTRCGADRAAIHNNNLDLQEYGKSGFAIISGQPINSLLP